LFLSQLLKYRDLPHKPVDGRTPIIAEYVWIDAAGGTRSKSKVRENQESWTETKR